MDGSEVPQRVVVTGDDVVDSIGAWLTAEMADSLIPPQDDEAPGTPVFWKSLPASGALP